MRIVAGRFKGRPLATPKDHRTRPTSDKVRESVFNLIAHGAEFPPLDGARVIDLFAGTGALGFEALSRGAQYALFVEDSASARALIQQNIEALGLQGITRIFRRDATKLGRAGARDRYRFAFLDPPYGKGLGDAGMKALLEGGWLAADSVVILEEHADAPVSWPAGVEVLDRRRYGDTAVYFARYLGDGLAADGGALPTGTE